MTDEQIIHNLEVNRDANPNRPKFVEACNRAITAIRENGPLKSRCFVLSGGALCMFCQMECNALRKKAQEGQDGQT